MIHLHVLPPVLGLQLSLRPARRRRLLVLGRAEDGGVEVPVFHPFQMVLLELPMLQSGRLGELLGVGCRLHHRKQVAAVPEAQDLLAGGGHGEAGMLRVLGFAGALVPHHRVEEHEPAAHHEHLGGEIQEVVNALRQAVRRRGGYMVGLLVLRDGVRIDGALEQLPASRFPAPGSNPVGRVADYRVEHLACERRRGDPRQDSGSE